MTADTASHRTPGRAGRHPCRLASPATASVLGALLLVPAAATLTLKGFDHQLTTSGTGWGFAIVLIYGGVGLVVARRQPRNPIGWLLLIFIVLYVLGAGATEYAVLAYSLGHRGLPLVPVAVVLDTLQAPALALFPPVILLFPDGRLTSRRWRRVLWVYAALVASVVAVTVAQAIAAVASHDIRLGTSGNLTDTFNPPEWLTVPVLISIGAIWLSFVARPALFNPLRQRVQRAVDRRFNRARYDAGQTVAAFAARLKDAVDLDAVRDDLASVVHQALEPAHVSLWISQRD